MQSALNEDFQLFKIVAPGAGLGARDGPALSLDARNEGSIARGPGSGRKTQLLRLTAGFRLGRLFRFSDLSRYVVNEMA